MTEDNKTYVVSLWRYSSYGSVATYKGCTKLSYGNTYVSFFTQDGRYVYTTVPFVVEEEAKK